MSPGRNLGRSAGGPLGVFILFYFIYIYIYITKKNKKNNKNTNIIIAWKFCNLLIARIWTSDFVFKADHFAREYGDVNPGIPFWPEGGDTANLSASLRLPFQAHIFYTLVDAVCGHLCQPSVTLRDSGRSQS